MSVRGNAQMGVIMNKILENYLEKIDKYLRPMPTSERVDITSEIKSEIHELETQNGLSAEEIIEKLGNPKDLAKAYLGESIAKNPSFSLRKLCAITAFYSLAGIGSMFILPCLSVMSVSFMLIGAFSPIAGAIDVVAFLFRYNLPFVSFQFGSYTLHPLLAFPFSILLGIFMFLAGKGLWDLMIKYIQMLSQQKNRLAQ